MMASCASAVADRAALLAEVDRLTPRWRDGEPPDLAHVYRREPDGYIIVLAAGAEGRMGFWAAGEWHPWGVADWCPLLVPG